MHETRCHRYKNYTSSTDDGDTTPVREYVSISKTSTCENSINTNICGTVLPNNTTYLYSTILRIDTYLNRINSTMQTEEPTDLISTILEYDRSYNDTSL